MLGFGTGNYQDAKMQTLADKGNGNHAYIDNILEAKKVLVNEFGSTLFAIAKDVKLQIEFNPQTVKAYRLIGYENRMLAAEDFNDDKKDAGEIGAGHSVTALYEIVPHGAETNVRGVDPRRYQNGVQPKEVFAQKPDEFGIVKVRYKLPDEDVSTKFEHVVNIADNLEVAGSHNLKWSAAVAEFSLLLRDSKFKGNASYEQVIDLAKQSVGYDEEGYRAEFIGLVKRVAALDDRHTTDPQLSRAE